MEGRLPGARGVGSPTGGWKPPLLQPTAGGINSEKHPWRRAPPPVGGAVVRPRPHTLCRDSSQLLARPSLPGFAAFNGTGAGVRVVSLPPLRTNTVDVAWVEAALAG